jgi:hypothetical protein
MTRIDAAQRRVQLASDLAAVLDAAYEQFEAMLSVLHPAQDPASDLFTTLVVAAVRRERPQRPGPSPSPLAPQALAARRPCP